MSTPALLVLERLGIDGPAAVWARDEPRAVGEAWGVCPRGEWLLDVVAHLGEADRRAVVRAASDCVALALPFATSAPVAAHGWATARRWVAEAATDADCRAAGVQARDAADAGTGAARTAATLRAVAHLALACDESGDATHWAGESHAAEAVRLVGDVCGDAATRALADLVRGHFPFESVARGLAHLIRTPIRSGVETRASVPSTNTSRGRR